MPSVYLVFDDWSRGHSIREVIIPSSGSAISAPADAKPTPPVFLRLEARHGAPQHFVSAFGTNILAMHSRYYEGNCSMIGGFTTMVDVRERSLTLFPGQFYPCHPIYFSDGDKLFCLSLGSFEMIVWDRDPPLDSSHGGESPWEQLPEPPFGRYDVTSYAVQPQSWIFVVSTKIDATEATFAFDMVELSWKRLGSWALPFDGRGHFDQDLNAFVGLSKEPDTLGQLGQDAESESFLAQRVDHLEAEDCRMGLLMQTGGRLIALCIQKIHVCRLIPLCIQKIHVICACVCRVKLVFETLNAGVVLDFIRIKEIPQKHIVNRWTRDASLVISCNLTREVALLRNEWGRYRGHMCSSTEQHFRGQLYFCYVPIDGTSPRLSSKLGEEKLFSQDPAERHVSAILVYIGTGESEPSKFCLVQRVFIEGDNTKVEGDSSADQELKIEGDSAGEELKEKGRFLYRLTTFCLYPDSIGGLTTGNSRRVQYYEVPQGTSQQFLAEDPVAFGM
uniref:Uncharacterized protein n=1 Tax=Aegilops tauschii TaxID=37682 RepID=M8CVK2_AEGTA